MYSGRYETKGNKELREPDFGNMMVVGIKTKSNNGDGANEQKDNSKRRIYQKDQFHIMKK